MDARRTRHGVVAVIVVALLASGVARATRPSGPIAAAGPPDTVRVSEAERAAVARFAPEVAPGDRAWIEAAIASARPEAQALIGVVDGLVEFRTIPGGYPIGVTRPRYHGGAASFTIDLNIGQLDGKRVQDRSTTVLHELGHVVDLTLVPQELNDSLDAGIPRTGACGMDGPVRTGSCAEPIERFADTFAKWALRGGVSEVGAGYDIATPPSLEDWGAPLVPLANP
jgi:hypothetical protein